jgi:hypothetical protein
MAADCGADWARAPALGQHTRFQLNAMGNGFLTSPRAREEGEGYGLAPIIARRASASPISTKAEVTSGPPTRMRVGVFILFHS